MLAHATSSRGTAKQRGFVYILHAVYVNEIPLEKCPAKVHNATAKVGGGGHLGGGGEGEFSRQTMYSLEVAVAVPNGQLNSF